MIDTAFHVPVPQQPRLAEAFAKDPDTGTGVQLVNVKSAPKFESGGGGLASTTADYARFLADDAELRKARWRANFEPQDY